jgi:hypothetical protein
MIINLFECPLLIYDRIGQVVLQAAISALENA